MLRVGTSDEDAASPVFTVETNRVGNIGKTNGVSGTTTEYLKCHGFDLYVNFFTPNAIAFKFSKFLRFFRFY